MTGVALVLVVLLAGSSGLAVSSWLTGGGSLAGGSLAGGSLAGGSYGRAWPLRLGWGWVLGQGMVSAAAGLCVLAGASPVLGLGVPALVLAFLLPRLLKRSRLDSGPVVGPVVGLVVEPVAAPDRWLRTIALGFGFLAVMLAWTTSGLGWDGLAIWGLKARVIAETGTLSLGTLREAAAMPSHPEYPLHVPLLAGVAGRLAEVLGGSWQDRVVTVFAGVDVLAIALLLAGMFERRGLRASRRILLAGGMLVPLMWREVPEGKADLTLALCVLAATCGVMAWLQGTLQGTLQGKPGEERGVLLIVGAAAGIGAFTKQEGLVWLLIVGGVATVLAPAARRSQLFAPAALALLIAAPWHLLRLIGGLLAEPFALSVSSFSRLSAVVTAMLAEMVQLGHWGLLWFGVWLALLLLDWRALEPRGSNRLGRGPGERADLLAAGVLVSGLAAIVLFFLATPHDLAWHLETALARLLLQWWPVALVVIDGGLEAAGRRFASVLAQR